MLHCTWYVCIIISVFLFVIYSAISLKTYLVIFVLITIVLVAIVLIQIHLTRKSVCSRQIYWGCFFGISCSIFLKINNLINVRVINELAKVKLDKLSVQFLEFSDHLFQEAVTQRWSIKKVLLKILPNSQEKNCLGVSFLKQLEVPGLQLY